MNPLKSFLVAVTSCFLACIPEENIQLLASRCKEMGGTITLIGKPGGGHHPHSLSDPKPVVQFIKANPN